MLLAFRAGLPPLALVFDGCRGDSAPPRRSSPACWSPTASRSSCAVCCCCSRCCSPPSRRSPACSDEDDMTEFYVLMLGALVGMCLMISANHMLIVMLGVEMASVPCYVLAGMKRQPAQEQRGRPEIRRLRRRHGGRDALRHEPAGGRARLGPPADDDRSTGRVAPEPAASRPARRRCWSSAA